MNELAEVVRLDYKSDIAVVSLSRPPVNAINGDVLDRLYRIHEELTVVDRIGAVIVRSHQRMFSPGVDIRMISGFLSEPTGGPEKMVAFTERIQRLFQLWGGLPMPTIAAMSGTATGGGLEFGLACDLRVASTVGKYGLPEAGIGLMPAAGGTQMLARIAGQGVARRLILTAELVDGVEAQRLGIVHYCAPPDEVDRMAFRLAEKICAGSVLAGRAIKEAIDHAPAPEGYAAEINGIARLVRDDRTGEMVRAFMDRHPTK